MQYKEKVGEENIISILQMLKGKFAANCVCLVLVKVLSLLI